MQPLRRKVLLIFLLIVFVAGVAFACFCFVPLEQQQEDNARLMIEEGGVHQDHIYYGEDDLTCPGCHSMMWRFNVRFRENKEKWDEAEKKAQREEERLKKVEAKTR